MNIPKGGNVKRTVILACMLFGLGLTGLGQHFYAFYYDLSGGQDLSVNLVNVMESPTQYQLKVYDVAGRLLWSFADHLEAYEASYYLLSDYVSAGTNSWGVVTVESGERLVIGLEYLANGTVVSVDTVYREVPVLEAGVPYWLGAYYTQAAGLTCGAVVMNPWAAPTSVTVSIYNAEGAQLYQQEVYLNPHESTYLDLETLVGVGGLIWGLVDVEMAGRAVVVALEYYGEVLDIKNVTEYYF
jgi:hypothetical protein